MPLLSVVVPTHNRSAYAISCIEAVLRFKTSDLQLVVTDTSDDDRLLELLQRDRPDLGEDDRLIYRKLGQPSSLTKNHNDALALATGEYVCVIGDDDCITGAAIDAARWASENQTLVVSQTVGANYAWPDFRSRMVGGAHAGRLYVPRGLGEGRWRNSAQDLQASLALAFQGTDSLPRCYHGVVRRELLERARDRTGAYFHGSSPDMSGAVSLACLVDSYFEVDIPLSIPGASGGSNSGRSAMNTHKGKLSSETQTSAFHKSGWSAGVPRMFSVETVWAHAGLTTLQALRPDLMNGFNYARLIALCALRHPEYESECDAALTEAEAAQSRNLHADVARERSKEKWTRRRYLLRRAMRPTAANGREFLADIPTISAASQRYCEYATAMGFSFGGSI